MWVKICGNTNIEDAQTAAELGADAVGFVFAESKRQVTAAQVAVIAHHLPAALERVGVFDSLDLDEIARIAAEAGLTAVQLHGGLTHRLLEGLANRFSGGVRIIQTLHWAVDEHRSDGRQNSSGSSSGDRLSAQLRQIAAAGIADRILIDSKVGTVGGGTGIAFDWSAARMVFANRPARMQMILAGGLQPANVAAGIAQLLPWGVDVSSGVEAAPGRKDPELLSLFIRNARNAQTP